MYVYIHTHTIFIQRQELWRDNHESRCVRVFESWHAHHWGALRGRSCECVCECVCVCVRMYVRSVCLRNLKA